MELAADGRLFAFRSDFAHIQKLARRPEDHRIESTEITRRAAENALLPPKQSMSCLRSQPPGGGSSDLCVALSTRKREPRQAREGATVARKGVTGPFLFVALARGVALGRGAAAVADRRAVPGRGRAADHGKLREITSEATLRPRSGREARLLSMWRSAADSATQVRRAR